MNISRVSGMCPQFLDHPSWQMPAICSMWSLTMWLPRRSKHEELSDMLSVCCPPRPSALREPDCVSLGTFLQKLFPEDMERETQLREVEEESGTRRDGGIVKGREIECKISEKEDYKKTKLDLKLTRLKAEAKKNSSGFKGDRHPAPSMPSALQLPPVPREPHDEDDGAWARSRCLHQNVGREADAFLVIAAIVFFVFCIYAFFYLNLSTELDLDVDLD
ncbi:hypothetical protein F7725_025070 [Dissostichus mawsoni]|uniref:Triple QxxK/R motif-containing protein n=1 Tax=Dissostichus mawsoni TaxID=36200 RepID=A0A7J5XA36_DISMA|nr:hypothetical protein F7725_025070 [Dissostichus mawsoni]